MDDENHHPHWLSMSPVLVGLFGVLAGVIVVAICHCIITKCNTQRSSTSFTIFGSSRRGSNDSSESRVSSAVMEHSTIQVIVETKSTSKESGRDDVCAICLGEFKQGEEVRVLRECAHVFHVSCIDKWLVNHPNCPLCRAFAVPPSHFIADLSAVAPMNLNVV